MRKLIILRGNSGSGKTTVAKMLQEKFGANTMLIFHDMVLPFEETVRRHSTKPNRGEFGEAEMRRWWKEEDYLSMIPQTILKEDISLEAAVERIYREVTA